MRQLNVLREMIVKSRACLQFSDRYRYETKRNILVKNVIQQLSPLSGR